MTQNYYSTNGNNDERTDGDIHSTTGDTTDTPSSATYRTNETTNSSISGGVNFLAAHKIDTVMWTLRLVTFISGIFFLIPIMGKQFIWYQRVLISNAAISALKLHTRLPNFRATREFLGTVLTEDSCHYLIYSLIFLYFSTQITLAIIPPVLYALLHALLYTGQVLDAFNLPLPVVRNAMAKVTSHQVTLLRLIACTEIFLMPAIIAGVFVGKGNLFVPFMYYRFLTFRYASRRNPYCRIMFSEMRVALQELSNHPKCPMMARGLLYRFITFMSRLAPATAN